MRFRDRWIDLLHRVATGTKKTRTLLTPVSVTAFVLAHVWELENIEEPELVKRLGDEYVEYRARTPMFLPRLPPRRR